MGDEADGGAGSCISYHTMLRVAISLHGFYCSEIYISVSVATSDQSGNLDWH